MDTATRMNQLLGRAGPAACVLTDPQYPDVGVRLAVHAVADDTEGIVASAPLPAAVLRAPGRLPDG